MWRLWNVGWIRKVHKAGGGATLDTTTLGLQESTFIFVTQITSVAMSMMQVQSLGMISRVTNTDCGSVTLITPVI